VFQVGGAQAEGFIEIGHVRVDHISANVAKSVDARPQDILSSLGCGDTARLAAVRHGSWRPICRDAILRNRGPGGIASDELAGIRDSAG
jgi:hypothetical protein